MANDGISGGNKLKDWIKKRSASLQGAHGGRTTARVGFLENARYPDGTYVATIAALNEFGVPDNNQPPRPFFRTMISAKSGEWSNATKIQLKKTNYNIDKTLDLVGSGIAGQLRQSIVDLTSPPLSPVTIAMKSRGGVGALHGVMGPEKPLVDTGYMLSRVDHEVVGS